MRGLAEALLWALTCVACAQKLSDPQAEHRSHVQSGTTHQEFGHAKHVVREGILHCLQNVNEYLLRSPRPHFRDLVWMSAEYTRRLQRHISCSMEDLLESQYYCGIQCSIGCIQAKHC